MQNRLQKILSEAGIASRRTAETMIVNGRVRVNGLLVRELGTKADPEKDTITVDGRPIKIREGKVYLAFHKPMNVMVTRKDPEGRPTVFDYLKDVKERVNPVGRLDFDSEGLVLLTNDGELLARLTHPRHEVPKVYQVKVSGRLGPDELKKLSGGIDIGEYVTRPCAAKILKENPHNTWVEIVLKEGKNRQVRRMIEALGNRHEVLRLVRAAIGPIRLNDLPKGRWRHLTGAETAALLGLKSGNRPGRGANAS